MRYDLTFKIIIAGEHGVGKTTLLYRFVKGKFLISTKSTLGVDIIPKHYSFQDGVLCTLQLWDFGGQKKFRFLMNNFIRGADGALLLFDLTSMRSFLKLDNWVRIIRKIAKEIPIILIGSKYDLVEEPIIEDDKAVKFKESHNLINYIKTSSKSGYHIKKAFDELILTVRDKQDLTEKEN